MNAQEGLKVNGYHVLLRISIHLYRGAMRDLARLKFSAFGAQVGHLAAQHRHGLRQVEALALQQLDLLPFTKWMKSGIKNSGLAELAGWRHTC